MTASETVGALAAALAKAQAELPVVRKSNTAKVPTKSGGGYSYTYADLADVTASVLPILAAHGLCFVCLPGPSERGLILTGTLLHESGEYLTASLPLSGVTPQEIGSSLTYMRRYLLGAITGVVTDDDDDGAAAATRAARKPPAEIMEALAVDDRDWMVAIASATTTAELRAIWEDAHGLGLAMPDFNARLETRRVEIESETTDRLDGHL